MKGVFQILLLGVLFLVACDNKQPTEPITPTEQTIEITDVPVFKLNTNGAAIGKDFKIKATYELIQKDKTSQQGIVGIEYRGSTSFMLFEKKSYNIEIRNEAGDGISVPLLGMPEEEDWVLYGPYVDKTLLRNVLIYELSNQIGMYASRTQFVELYLNAKYEGVYVLIEKIKRDKNRVAIKKLEAKDIDNATITGGYILKIDKAGGDSPLSGWDGDADYRENYSFRSEYDTKGELMTFPPYNGKDGQETYFIYAYPKSEDIRSEQKIYIKNYINSFEKALLNDDFSTTTRTYTNYIDLDSFADFFILNELSANPDAYRLSTYLYKDRDGKLKMGPIWDFNLAFGLDSRSRASEWIYKYNEQNSGDLWLVHFWWPRLMQDTQFRKLIKSKWQAYRVQQLSEENINKIISEKSNFLISNGAISRNFKRWLVLGAQLPFNDFVGKDYPDEINYTKDWLKKRLQWMDGQIGAF